jgi:hypothetical protein
MLVAPLAETRFIGIGMNQSEYTDSLTSTLTNPTGTSTGETTADGTVDTDQAEGTLYFVVTTSSTSPSQTQVKNGEDDTGSVATTSGSQAVSATGTQTVSATGLTADTTYYFHFMHENTDNLQSDVATSGSFTTAAASFSCTSAGQGEHTVDGDTIYCDGSDNMWTPTLDLPADGTNNSTYAWSDTCDGTTTDCNSGTDGEANTTCILSNCDDGGTNAAEQCDALTYAGESDWYLPGITTVEGLYDECISNQGLSDGDSCLPTFDDNAQSSIYWSSTEDSGNDGLILPFSAGIVSLSSKSSTEYIRCVRK